MTIYWQHVIHVLENETHEYKIHQLPLARIKKVMKADPDVKMIAAEAPILFAKGCEIFITELTMRAWIHAEENKRRTLQRSDIASALAKSDMFDFLIDIVPREEAVNQNRKSQNSQTTSRAQGNNTHDDISRIAESQRGEKIDRNMPHGAGADVISNSTNVVHRTERMNSAAENVYRRQFKQNCEPYAHQQSIFDQQLFHFPN